MPLGRGYLGPAAILLALVVLADSSPSLTDCSSNAPCDTSYGFGASVIAVITAPSIPA
jgi:hypothetical protein